jgi:phytoene synthase
VTAFAALAREHLRKAEAAIAGLAPQLKVAFLPLAVVAPLLALAEKRGARALSEPLQLSALRRMWANFRRAGTGSR